MPEFMVPTHVVILERLPLTPNGKVDRNALPDPNGEVAPDGATDPVDDPEAPRTEVERKMGAIWEELLSENDIGRNGHFFDLGGNSLIALQLMNEIKRTFQVRLPLRSIFEAPRVRDMAALVQEQRVQDVDIGALSSALNEIEQLSDDEVKRLLDS
jgi:acyl carrier protein